jgi:peptidyl-prolyl cis-trans isomerase C
MKCLNPMAAAMAAVLILLVLAVPAAMGGQNSAADKIAEVNGVVITRSEFDQELKQFKNRMARQGMDVPDSMQAKIETNILGKLVDRELLYQDSQKKGIDVASGTVDQEIETLKKRYPDTAAFDAMLKQVGMTEKEIRILIVKGTAVKQLVEGQVIAGITVSDAESREFYKANPDYFNRPEQIRASHILVKLDAGADKALRAKAEKKIEMVRKKLDKGEDFGALAREYSEGPSAPKGGDLGFFGRGQMVKPFEAVAFALAPNTVSDIVETRFGLHLIRVAEKRPAGTVEFKDARERIIQNLGNRKRQQAMDSYLEKLRKTAKIEKNL